MIDVLVLDEHKARLADRYTAAELVDLLDLDVWRVIEAFEEDIMNIDVFKKEQER